MSIGTRMHQVDLRSQLAGAVITTLMLAERRGCELLPTSSFLSCSLSCQKNVLLSWHEVRLRSWMLRSRPWFPAKILACSRASAFLLIASTFIALLSMKRKLP
jgi:hypothetical protein